MTVRSSTAGVYVALVGNILVVATKTLAASVTGSSAMFAEAVHSLVDTSDEVLLLYGLKRSHASPDERHPLGYGRELYFWSFIVAVLIFAIGCGASIWEGARELQHPKPIEHPRSELCGITGLAAFRRRVLDFQPTSDTPKVWRGDCLGRNPEEQGSGAVHCAA
jgi:divalent metal cation (Fe/Co/Zn/Cd) transporter